jgi:hypothetical protein
VFRAKIRLLDVNPYVAVPARERRAIFRAAGRDTGPIPVQGTLDLVPFRQTFVKYQGAWRLYLNTPLRRALGKDVGDVVDVQVEFDATPRHEPLPALLKSALAERPEARRRYAALTPSRQKEICRYLNGLKTEQSRQRNLSKVLSYLCGESDGTAAAFLRTRPLKAK